MNKRIGVHTGLREGWANTTKDEFREGGRNELMNERKGGGMEETDGGRSSDKKT